MLGAVVALAIAGGSGVPGAVAEPPPPSDDDLKAAVEHFERAEVHYHLRRFEEAVAEYEEAYELSRKPALLFNVAQAHRLAGNYDQAEHFYRTYLRLAPDAPNRADAERYLAEVIEARESQPEARPEPTDGQGQPAPEEISALAARPEPAPSGGEVSAGVGAPSSGSRRVWGVAAVATSIGMAATGGYLHYRVFAIRDRLAEGVEEPRYGQLVDKLRARERGAWALYGGAALCAGVGLYLLLSEPGGEASPVGVVASPDGAALSFAGAF